MRKISIPTLLLAVWFAVSVIPFALPAYAQDLLPLTGTSPVTQEEKEESPVSTSPPVWDFVRPGERFAPGNLPNTAGPVESATASVDDASPAFEGPRIEFETVTLDLRGRIHTRDGGKVSLLSEELGPELWLDLAYIPGGTFVRGSDPHEEGHRSNELPRSEVTVAPFFLGVYEVTQNQWAAVAELPQVERPLDPDPSYFKGDERPVEMISYEDCLEFCARLAQATGREYRPPTEAEWEYACRAGTETPFHFGPTISPEVANYFSSKEYGAGPTGPYSNETARVGFYGYANAFGLFDMHGNVWEWCADFWHADYRGAPSDGSAWVTGGDRMQRVQRGGGWRNFAVDLRSGARKPLSPKLRYNLLGFRAALSEP
jgi:formylglycine-generating enzyme required for sulfatase activity